MPFGKVGGKGVFSVFRAGEATAPPNRPSGVEERFKGEG